MINLYHLLLRQYDIGKPGVYFIAARQAFNGIWSYTSYFSFPMIFSLFWEGSVRQSITTMFPWFTFHTFIIVSIGIIALGMALQWKFGVPSEYRYSNEQACKHSNPFLDEIKVLQHKCDTNNELIQQLQSQVQELVKHERHN